MGSAALGDFTPEFDTATIRRLREAGFIFVGKTNTPEFGLLPVAEPVAHGATRNPWNTGHSAGGSSGGSASAVASLMVPAAHGGDGGGSIRIPASMCGLFGLKPSRGRVSLGPDENEGWAGLVVRGSLTHTVRDSAAILDVIQGYMPGDPYTAPPPTRPYRDVVGADAGRLRIALHTSAPGELAATDPECVAATEDAARLLESLGHTVERAAPPAFDEGEMLQSFTTILFASVAADIVHLSKLAGREITAADVEPMTWIYNESARMVTAEQYVTALGTAHDWSRRIVTWFFDAGYDLMLTPTLAEPPPEIGDVASRPDDPMRPLTRALPFALYTGPFNMTGQPAMSVPTYWSTAGLPIGVQVVGRPNREDVLYRLAAQIEQARPWVDRVPPLHA
jgi:amidase